jgi:hypothetical protein
MNLLSWNGLQAGLRIVNDAHLNGSLLVPFHAQSSESLACENIIREQNSISFRRMRDSGYLWD